MDHTEVLETARSVVNGDRQTAYGTPENNFQRIADLWTAYDGRSFCAHDVAMFLALLKAARIKTGVGTDDSYVDMCGYASLAADMRMSKEEPTESKEQAKNKQTTCQPVVENLSTTADSVRFVPERDLLGVPEWYHIKPLLGVDTVSDVANIVANNRYEDGNDRHGDDILLNILSHVIHADNTHPWTDYSAKQALDVIQAELDEAREQYEQAREYGYERRDAPLCDEQRMQEHLDHMYYEIGDMIAPAIKLLRMQYE